MKNRIAILIEEKYGDMRSSEKQAADYVLAHMDKVRELSLEKLAANSGVSQPTIVRMTKALGFQGYKEFRYAVIEQLAEIRKENSRANPMYGYTLSGQDRLEDIPGKVAVTSQMMMEETLKNLSADVFKKVICALKKARIIDIYSVENSNAVASDLLTKLLYLGLSCRHFDDYYHQKISAGNLTDQDVAVGISYSGYSRDTVEVMKEAKKSGTVTIVITNFRDSLITKYADLVICTSQQQLFYGDAIFSRTAQMMIVDMIYMGLIVSDYDRFCTVLDKSSRAVRDKAYSSL
jgi:DNA-binding MurR/RpiR family transcriptional regulator